MLEFQYWNIGILNGFFILEIPEVEKVEIHVFGLTEEKVEKGTLANCFNNYSIFMVFGIIFIVGIIMLILIKIFKSRRNPKKIDEKYFSV